MVEGGRVMKWNPSITALVIGIIVWLLQRGPLNYGTFKPGVRSFIICNLKNYFILENVFTALFCTLLAIKDLIS